MLENGKKFDLDEVRKSILETYAAFPKDGPKEIGRMRKEAGEPLAALTVWYLAAINRGASPDVITSAVGYLTAEFLASVATVFKEGDRAEALDRLLENQAVVLDQLMSGLGVVELRHDAVAPN